MIKVLLTACLLLSSSLVADIARVELGGGVWMQTPTGDFSVANTAIAPDEEQMTNNYAWAMFKHPTPVIPNIRAEYVTLSSENKAGAASTDLDITQYDVIPYYNILDNTFWFTLDLGIDLKVTDVKNASTANAALAVQSEVVIPMLYARTRFQLPLFGLAGEIDGKYVSYSSNTVYDVRAKIDYTFDITPIIQPGIELGYRVQKMESDEFDSLNLNMDFSGVYAGVMLRF